MPHASPPALDIASDGTHLLRAGRPAALCADTAWSAFADATPAEWRNYVRLRHIQGFNSVLISVLPILHDRSVNVSSREPYEVHADGTYNFDRPRKRYFAQARELAEIAVQAGLTPMLVVLWCNYVPGTWGADRTPWAPLSDVQRADHLERVADAFADLNPVFVVSGDEHFRDDEPIAVYDASLTAMKDLAPACLTTLHSTPDADLPAVLAHSPALDFYVYQSGHNSDRQELAYELAELHRDKPQRPLMNAEPCYEGHGFAGGSGRFTEREVRRATWWSLLGGASAGIGYGAHGVWQWHRPDGRFTNAGFSMEPFSWSSALDLPGAWDVGWARHCVEEHGLVGAAPRQDLLVGMPRGVRAAVRDDVVGLYVPFAQALTLRIDAEPLSVHGWALESRRRIVLSTDLAGGETQIAQVDTPGDLFIAIRLREAAGAPPQP